MQIKTSLCTRQRPYQTKLLFFLAYECQKEEDFFIVQLNELIYLFNVLVQRHKYRDNEEIYQNNVLYPFWPTFL